MSGSHALISSALLIPLAVVITYFDGRFRRIPNAFVLATLISGLAINTITVGWTGLLMSLGGCALAFVLMFVLHIFGAMGAGDVKLFAAIGSVIGAPLVLPTFLVVVLTGGLLAVFTMVRAGAVVFGLVAAVSVSRYLSSAQAYTKNLNNVVVAKVDIPAGTKVVAEQLETVQFPSNAMPNGVFETPDKLVGRVAIVQIAA